MAPLPEPWESLLAAERGKKVIPELSPWPRHRRGDPGQGCPVDRQPLLDPGRARAGLQLGAAEDKSVGAAWGAPETPFPSPCHSPLWAQRGLGHRANQLCPAASIESIAMWIIKAVPSEGNVSLDPFLFSIGRTGWLWGSPCIVGEQPVGSDLPGAKTCGLLSPRHLEQLQPGSAGLGPDPAPPGDQPCGPGMGGPETPSLLQ